MITAITVGKKTTFSDYSAYVWIQRALITAGTAAPLPRTLSTGWHSGGDRKCCRHMHIATPTNMQEHTHSD